MKMPLVYRSVCEILTKEDWMLTGLYNGFVEFSFNYPVFLDTSYVEKPNKLPRVIISRDPEEAMGKFVNENKSTLVNSILIIKLTLLRGCELNELEFPLIIIPNKEGKPLARLWERITDAQKTEWYQFVENIINGAVMAKTFE